MYNICVYFSGASFFFIMLHASLYISQEELEGFDIEMDSVETVWASSFYFMFAFNTVLVSFNLSASFC